uniref:Septum-promoting GTP-binding protein 1 n=1 Tax=Percolomonas cosmopolitus TaxID=63605 RepID=A0A7S1KMR1_9EUKA
MSQKNSSDIVVKVSMLGDVQVGKTSLMVKYVDGKFDEDYIMTLGVNFLEKRLKIKNHEVKLMIWDLGGKKEFNSMLDLVTDDAQAIFFMFDLTRRASLINIKDWFMQAKKQNPHALRFLVGTKYDQFIELPEKEQENITKQARKYAQKMECEALVFSSAAAGVNVKKLFKLVIAKSFDLKPKSLRQVSKIGEPIIEWDIAK